MPTHAHKPIVPELNLPETLLKQLSNVNSLVKGVFSADLNANVTPDGPRALHAGILGDLASQADRIPKDLQVLCEGLYTAAKNGLNNDKDYLQEKIVALAASLPSDSASALTISNKFVDLLWTNLQHPQMTYLGDEWKYRTADGSNNNKMYPQLGKAGSPYARTVPPTRMQPPNLPDAGLIFDELMARVGKPKEHPNKISSTLFHFATIIIHDIFRTNSRDNTIVDNSSYLDLSPLYGNSEESQAKVRTFRDGLLEPDTFSESRLLGFPPGVAALIICFNRFHNYVAGELATINEGGRFTLKPRDSLSATDEAKYGTPEKKRDNDLFQTARLVTCGLYVNIILFDYVKTIINLNHSHSDWAIDPRANPAGKYGPSGVPEGVGNAVSVEFNLIYRWHSAISQRDEQWSIDFFKQQFPDKDPSKLTTKELGHGFYKFLAETDKIDPSKWTFDGLRRNRDGTFEDKDLIAILTSATEDCAAAFGARQVPLVMRTIEILGIEQGRQWQVASLNEFRQFFGMEPHKNFTDISSDPDVAQSLETLYGEPDNVELYPGLVCEDAKEPRFPGSGLCPGFTISRAVLADAVSLVRGDRFYTLDYNARSLTNWGFAQIQGNGQIAQGGVFYTLLHRAFPNWYTAGSVYAMYPFTVPEKTKEIMTTLGNADQYEFGRPCLTQQPVQINTWKAITGILANPKHFTVPWGRHTRDISHHNYMLSGDTPVDIAQHAYLEKAIYSPVEGMKEIRTLYEKVTMDLITEHSRSLRTGFQLDVVQNVANLSHSIAIGKLFKIPLKLPEHTFGALTAIEFYTIMSVLFAYVFLDVDDGKAFALKQGAMQSGAAIGKIVEAIAWEASHDQVLSNIPYWISNTIDMIRHNEDPVPDYGTKLIRRMFEGGKSLQEVTWTIVPTIAAAVATQAQGLAQVIDLLLEDEYYHYWGDLIIPLAKSREADAFEKMERVALECLRLATPAFGVLRNVEAASSVQDGHNTVHVAKGQQVFTNFVTCGLDAEVFPEPKKIRLDRDRSTYIHHGWGTHACVGRGIVTTALASQLKCLARLKNIRRAPGNQGTMKHKIVGGAFKVYMKPDWSDYWPFPTTMKIMYDEVEAW